MLGATEETEGARLGHDRLEPALGPRTRHAGSGFAILAPATRPPISSTPATTIRIALCATMRVSKDRAELAAAPPVAPSVPAFRAAAPSGPGCHGQSDFQSTVSAPPRQAHRPRRSTSSNFRTSGDNGSTTGNQLSLPPLHPLNGGRKLGASQPQPRVGGVQRNPERGGNLRNGTPSTARRAARRFGSSDSSPCCTMWRA